MNAIKVNENGIAAGARWSMKQALESAAQYLSGGEHGANTFPWWEVRYQHTAAGRRHWAGQSWASIWSFNRPLLPLPLPPSLPW